MTLVVGWASNPVNKKKTLKKIFSKLPILSAKINEMPLTLFTCDNDEIAKLTSRENALAPEWIKNSNIFGEEKVS